MKKLFIVALLSSISLLGFTQTTNDTIYHKQQENVLKSIPDSSVLTFKEVYTDIKSGLGALGSALKVGSEHVYEVLVKQQLTNSITQILILICCIIGSLISIKYIKSNTVSYLKNKEEYDLIFEHSNGWGIIISTIITLFLSVTIISIILNMNIIITGFINPEYGAIKEILEVIK